MPDIQILYWIREDSRVQSEPEVMGAGTHPGGMPRIQQMLGG